MLPFSYFVNLTNYLTAVDIINFYTRVNYLHQVTYLVHNIVLYIWSSNILVHALNLASECHIFCFESLISKLQLSSMFLKRLNRFLIWIEFVYSSLVTCISTFFLEICINFSFFKVQLRYPQLKFNFLKKSYCSNLLSVNSAMAPILLVSNYYPWSSRHEQRTNSNINKCATTNHGFTKRHRRVRTCSVINKNYISLMKAYNYLIRRDGSLKGDTSPPPLILTSLEINRSSPIQLSPSTPSAFASNLSLFLSPTFRIRTALRLYFMFYYFNFPDLYFNVFWPRDTPLNLFRGI